MNQSALLKEYINKNMPDEDLLIVFLFAAGRVGSFCGVYLCGGHWFGYYCSFNNHIKEDKLQAKVRPI